MFQTVMIQQHHSMWGPISVTAACKPQVQCNRYQYHPKEGGGSLQLLQQYLAVFVKQRKLYR